jgi:hypothetical protein
MRGRMALAEITVVTTIKHTQVTATHDFVFLPKPGDFVLGGEGWCDGFIVWETRLPLQTSIHSSRFRFKFISSSFNTSCRSGLKEGFDIKA